MKRAFFMVVVVAVVAGLSGCARDRMYAGPQPDGLAGCMNGSCAQAPETCAECSPCMQCGLAMPACRCRQQPMMGGPPMMPGPPTGAVAYPYYTVHGPRDFLAKNPRALGP